MAKFIKKVLLFFAFISVVDIACGFGFNYLRSHAKGGDTKKNYYISEQCCDDVLILGSSRAARHYNPLVLEDSLGLSCYNCGEPGCGIITAYARYGMIEQRHTPKLVIYEVTPGFDYWETDDYSKYLGKIRQYADKPSVYELYYELGDNLEWLRLKSSLYKNNSFILNNLLDCCSKGNYIKGFEPLYGNLDSNLQPSTTHIDKIKIDSLKLSFMEKLIIKLQKEKVGLCFVVSPSFTSQENALLEKRQYVPIEELCRQYNIPFYNHTWTEGISDDYSMFQDIGHMNKKGASIYSGIVSEELKDIIMNFIRPYEQ